MGSIGQKINFESFISKADSYINELRSLRTTESIPFRSVMEVYSYCVVCGDDSQLASQPVGSTSPRFDHNTIIHAVVKMCSIDTVIIYSYLIFFARARAFSLTHFSPFCQSHQLPYHISGGRCLYLYNSIWSFLELLIEYSATWCSIMWCSSWYSTMFSNRLFLSFIQSSSWPQLTTDSSIHSLRMRLIFDVKP